MRDGEVHINVETVAKLIADQFPEYVDLPIQPVKSAGTDNAMFRLGTEMVVRLPRFANAEGQIQKEQEWLPILGPRLPLATPVPIGCGDPTAVFGMHWSIYEWLDGTNAFDEPIVDLRDAAVTLGEFGLALRNLDASRGPDSFRGGPIASKGAEILQAIEHLADSQRVDRSSALSAWHSIAQLPQWDRAPVWTHGDLLPGNILTTDGLVSSVIDFGGLGVGDPACDMMAAWTVLTSKERGLFREVSEVDDATWDRGRGWALCWGLMTEHFYEVTNPVLAAVARRSIAQSLPEFQ